MVPGFATTKKAGHLPLFCARTRDLSGTREEEEECKKPTTDASFDSI